MTAAQKTANPADAVRLIDSRELMRSVAGRYPSSGESGGALAGHASETARIKPPERTRVKTFCVSSVDEREPWEGA